MQNSMPKIAIVVSKKDLAGQTIKKVMLNSGLFSLLNELFDGNNVYNYKNFFLIELNELQIFADYLNEFNADFFVFASRHSSSKSIASLSVHSIGNYSKAELGGKNNTLIKSSAILSRNYFLGLKKFYSSFNLQGFELVPEVTHHGPYIEKPALFIEVGSTEKEWLNENAAKLITKTILECTSFEKEKEIIAIGLGGTHYAYNFAKLIERENYAFSHICPKHALKNLNENMLYQMIEKTMEEVNEIVLDWKGLGKEKQRIKEMLELFVKENNLKIKKI